MPRRGAKRPTIRDVAERAGVSRGTVSRYLNGGTFVSPQAARKVEKAIAATGYVANHSARSLATGRAGSIGFLLTEPQQLLFEDPNFSTLYRCAAAAPAEHDPWSSWWRAVPPSGGRFCAISRPGTSTACC